MKTYADYLISIFGPGKYQKLTLNAGNDCPNRDGSIGYGGCIYCSNKAFSPDYCHNGMSLTQQLEAGKNFFGRKYKDTRWLPYFQTYTSTNASIEKLRQQYSTIINAADVAGMVISTRPDTLPQTVIELLSSLHKPVIIELGAESSHDRTLQLLNRGHSWLATVDAVHRAADAGLHVGLHLIAGLPGEDEYDLFKTIDASCELPIDSIKLHHLQILKGTILAKKVAEGSINVPELTLENYINLCIKILNRIPPNIVIERFVAQAPPELLISPRWGLKNYQFMNLLQNRMTETSLT